MKSKPLVFDKRVTPKHLDFACAIIKDDLLYDVRAFDLAIRDVTNDFETPTSELTEILDTLVEYGIVWYRNYPAVIPSICTK